ncbi:MAG: putative Fe-S oxidoreductase [Bacteroidetes bacterium]|nr:putative Fe-S oxidoreductase [Bacteroidota bacterium]
MILFNEIIYGPVHSRRLGLSLGVNLLPLDEKICSFDCVYCECGANTKLHQSKIATREDVKKALEEKLKEMASTSQFPDVITFAGNGEPTLHPDFEGVIDDTIKLRNTYCPDAKVSVLTNSTKLHKPHVFNALKNVDNPILKFDSAIDRTMQLIDMPAGKHINVQWLKEQIKRFDGKMIIQTMFIRGENKGEKFDNTTEEEINAWLEALTEMGTKEVMIYALDREAPIKTVEKISIDELNKIAQKARAKGMKVSVAG